MNNTFLPFSKPTIDEATIASVAEVLRSGWITSGPKVQEFEKQLSAYFGGRPVRTFNSGTCTMEIALRIAGIGPGDEVITTPISWVATANVILEVGATPVFADALTVTVPDPRPDAPPVTVSQLASLLAAVHVQAAPVATVKVVDPPPDATVCIDGDTTTPQTGTPLIAT